MNMKKKVVTLGLVAAMLLTSAGATLAYFTDTKSATNTMTFGSVEIELIEKTKDENGNDINWSELKTPHTLMPAVFTTVNDKISVANKIDKRVSVTNTGNSDAYVRIIYAFEGTNAEVQDYIHAFIDEENWDYNPVYNSTDNKFNSDNDQLDARMIGTTSGNWTICEAVYAGPLAKYSNTGYSMTGFFLSPDADIDHTDDGVKNGVDTLFGDKYEIKVIAQAVQADGWEAVESPIKKAAPRNALDTAFGNLWDGNDVTDQELADWFGLGSIVQPSQP